MTVGRATGLVDQTVEERKGNDYRASRSLRCTSPNQKPKLCMVGEGTQKTQRTMEKTNPKRHFSNNKPTAGIDKRNGRGNNKHCEKKGRYKQKGKAVAWR